MSDLMVYDFSTSLRKNQHGFVRCDFLKQSFLRMMMGRNVIKYLDLNTARRVNQKQHKVNIDFPDWMIKQLEKEAYRLGITKQAIIKLWLSERLEQLP